MHHFRQRSSITVGGQVRLERHATVHTSADDAARPTRVGGPDAVPLCEAMPRSEPSSNVGAFASAVLLYSGDLPSASALVVVDSGDPPSGNWLSVHSGDLPSASALVAADSGDPPSGNRQRQSR